MALRVFKPLGFGYMVVFGIYIALGGVTLVLALMYLFESLPPAPPEGRWLRAAATAAAGVGVVLLICATSMLLRQVYELGKEVERLKADRPPGTSHLGTAAGSPQPGRE